MQENIIGKNLISNDKIQWKYGNGYFKSVGKNKPLTNAEQEIKIGSFWFDIYCIVRREGIGGHITVRSIHKTRNKKWMVDRIHLNGINNLSTDVIYKLIINWLKDYNQKINQEIQEMYKEVEDLINANKYRDIGIMLAKQVMIA